jgi:hypothetical protein
MEGDGLMGNGSWGRYLLLCLYVCTIYSLRNDTYLPICLLVFLYSGSEC